MKYSLLAIPRKGRPRPVKDGDRPRIFNSLDEVKTWLDLAQALALNKTLKGWQIVAELE